MASFWSIFATFMALIAFFALSAFPSPTHAQFSTISAAPAFLPSAPLPSAPSLSPDITPLFPTPGRGLAPSPTESSLPTIPSSPSPPNPDDVIAPGPELALPPSGSLPVSSSISLASTGPLKLNVFLGLLLCCLMQLACL